MARGPQAALQIDPETAEVLWTLRVPAPTIRPLLYPRCIRSSSIASGRQSTRGDRPNEQRIDCRTMGCQVTIVLFTVDDVAQRLHKSRRWLQNFLRGRPIGRLAGRREHRASSPEFASSPLCILCRQRPVLVRIRTRNPCHAVGPVTRRAALQLRCETD
jgi:hypothetical protein